MKQKGRRRNKSSPPSPPPPSSSPLGKVCTVCFFSTSKDYYAVLIVDLGSPSSSSSSSPLGDGGGSYISTAPTFLLDRSHLNNGIYVFCVLGSILYMFEIGDPAVVPPTGSSVYYVDLIHSESKSENLVLDKSKIHKLHDLRWPKFCTKAIPTPDGKSILVFSSMIHYNYPDLIVFELYDPVNNKGKILPSPKTSSPNYFYHDNGIPFNTYIIDSFAFITDSKFLIQSEECGIFTIDIYADNPTWQKMDSFAGSISIPLENRFYVLENHNLCIDGSKAYTFLNEKDQVLDCFYSEFPRSSMANDYEQVPLRFVDNHIIYGTDGTLFGSVRFQAGISKDTHYAHMRLDVYKFDLENFKKAIKDLGKRARLKVSVFKTFKFVLDGYLCSELMGGCCCPIVT